MAINPDSITSEITLELDEDVISVADFGKAYESFVGLVREVSKEVAPKHNPASWTVTVYPGSAGVGLSGMRGKFNEGEIDQIRGALLEGLAELAIGVRPIAFTDKAIEHSKNLAGLFKAKGASLQPKINIWKRREKAIAVTREIGKHAAELLAASYEEDGTVDGVLEKLDAHGKLNFVIYDVIDDRAVKCEVSEALLPQAWDAFRRRVEVIGSVKYRKDGMPVSIRASRILAYPDKSQIPSLDQMRALLSVH